MSGWYYTIYIYTIDGPAFPYFVFIYIYIYIYINKCFYEHVYDNQSCHQYISGPCSGLQLIS